MKYIDFAENERLSTIVLGMMRISELSEDEVEDLVEAALSIGINTFDLADIYGNGQCEQLLGKVLKTSPGSSGPDVDPVQVWDSQRRLYLFRFF